MPLVGRDDVDLIAVADAFRREAEAAGRDPDELQLTLFGVPPDAGRARRLAGGSITRILFTVLPAPASETLRELDGLARALDL